MTVSIRPITTPRVIVDPAFKNIELRDEGWFISKTERKNEANSVPINKRLWLKFK